MALRNICSPVIDHAILRHRRPQSGRLNYFHLLDDGFSNYSVRTTTGTPTTVQWYMALFKSSIRKRGQTFLKINKHKLVYLLIGSIAGTHYTYNSFLLSARLSNLSFFFNLNIKNTGGTLILLKFHLVVRQQKSFRTPLLHDSCVQNYA